MAEGAERIAYIDIGELGIDECNIRQGIWDQDQELISSVKKVGILEPLVVRPADPQSGKKYAVLCGSRRFNAAIDAGLPKVPCIIREDLDDIDAMALSMIENRQRKQTPLWMDIEYTGRMYHKCLNKGLSSSGSIDEVINRTGFSWPTVERYIRVFELPEEIKGLLREPEDRTTRQKEFLTLFRMRRRDRTLYLVHADLLTELNKFPLEKQMEVAVFILDKSSDLAGTLIDFVKMYPDRTVDEIFNEMIKKEFGWYEKTLRFDRETWGALSEACIDKQKYYDELCVKVIRGWLKGEGYLVPKGKKFMPEQTSLLELRELLGKAHVKVETSVKRLTECGYQFLKEEGGSRIYQRHEREISAFYKAFCRDHNIWLTLTPGSYDFPELLLNAEKERLESERH